MPSSSIASTNDSHDESDNKRSSGNNSNNSSRSTGFTTRFVVFVALGLVLASSLYASFQSVVSTQGMYDELQGFVHDYVIAMQKTSTAEAIEGHVMERLEDRTAENNHSSLRSSSSSSSSSQKVVPATNEDVKPAAAQAEDATAMNKDMKEETIQDTRREKPMNIVLFYADDWTFRTLGVINKNVKTPNIDEMARRGMMFRYNCVTTSICWISRATLVTGMTVAAHKQVKISSEAIFNNTVQWPDTLYPLLKKQGYHIGYIGKWHAPMPKEFKKQAFDYSKLYYGDHWMTRNGKRRHITDLNGEDALEYLRKVRPKDQHFALTVSFFATHSWDGKKYPDQYMPQDRTEPLYRNATIPVPKTATDKHWQDLPYFLKSRNEARNRWKQRYDTPEHFQVTMKRYYRMATEVDDVVGDVINELKAQGVYNNTLLIFTTDNGMFHGEHGLAGKWFPHEESVRVPLIIQDPRMPKSQIGKSNDEFTLNIDLAPTILSAAGSPVPPGMQGRDIAELYLNPEAASKSWRKDFFYEWNQGDPATTNGHALGILPVFALVRKDYKYFYWPKDKYEQMFHIEEDPFEENDMFLSTAQSNQSIYEEMKVRYAYLKNLSQSGHPV